MSTLIVTLPPALPTATMPCLAVLTSDGRTVLRQMETPLALLPQPTGSSTAAVAVVPVQMLSWHQVTLPRGTLDSKRLFQDGAALRLRAVLDGLLEEVLLDDTALLHCALAPDASDSQPVWVAVCNRAWLHAWLAALEQAGRPVGRIVPELAPLPYAEVLDEEPIEPVFAASATARMAAEATGTGAATLHVMGSEQGAYWLRSDAGGVTRLPLSLASAALANWPEGGPVFSEPATAELAEQLFRQCRITLQTPAQRSLAALNSRWDLAQFELRYNRQTRLRKHIAALLQSALTAPRWRPARWALATALLVNVVGLQAWAWKAQTELANQKSAIRTVLTSTFPEVQVVMNAPLQMARALALAERQSGIASAADLETMLVQIQTAAPGLPAPAAIEFVANELRFKGLEGSGIDLAGLVERLRTQGYTAQLDDSGLAIKPQNREGQAL